MKKISFLTLIFLGFGFLFFSAGLWAQTSSESIPPSSPVLENTGALGSVSFYLDPSQFQTEQNSVHVGQKDKVFFCLKLNPADARLKPLLAYLQRIDLTLESLGENPQKIRGGMSSENNILTPDSQGCYRGSFKIPAFISSGKYLLSEIDFWLTSHRMISLRHELEEFFPRGLVEVESIVEDRTPPRLTLFHASTPFKKRIHFGGGRGWAWARFQVRVQEDISGVKPNTFQIFFKVYLDGTWVDIIQPRCNSPKNPRYFACEISFSRSAPDLRSRTLEWVLDSVSLSDKAGNEVEWTRPEELKSLFGGEIFRYTFYSILPSKRPFPESQPKLEPESAP